VEISKDPAKGCATPRTRDRGSISAYKPPGRVWPGGKGGGRRAGVSDGKEGRVFEEEGQKLRVVERHSRGVRKGETRRLPCTPRPRARASQDQGDGSARVGVEGRGGRGRRWRGWRPARAAPSSSRRARAARANGGAHLHGHRGLESWSSLGRGRATATATAALRRRPAPRLRLELHRCGSASLRAPSAGRPLLYGRRRPRKAPPSSPDGSIMRALHRAARGPSALEAPSSISGAAGSGPPPGTLPCSPHIKELAAVASTAAAPAAPAANSRPNEAACWYNK
jgi:hypothetical protein